MNDRKMIDHIRDVLPRPLHIAHFSLHTKFSFRSDLTRDLCHLRSEQRQLVNHTVDSIHKIQNLALHRDSCHFLCQVTASDGGGGYGDSPHL